MTRPNVVVVVSDDQGPWAMGCAGNPEIRTPHLDRLAAEGMRFSSFFCVSPVCSPARASLLTGRIPSQHGVHDWLSEGNVGPDAVELLDGQVAYTDLLAATGYVCGLSGKWHLGHSLKPQHGFTYWYAYPHGGGPYNDVEMVRDGALVREPGYVTDLVTAGALRFLDAQDGSRPFYLSVQYTAPHSPWIGNHPQDLVDSYDDCAFESCPDEPAHPWRMPEAPGPEARRENLKGYFAATTAMDAGVGRILDRLDAMGVADGTLVVFTSDNGFNCGHHGIWGKGNATEPQTMFEESVKVPALFRLPGRVPAGTVIDDLVSGYDFMPTLLELVGIDNPGAERLPGRSFAPTLTGQSSTATRRSVVVFDEYGPVRMIRTRRWKYVHRYPYGPHELYDLEDDPGERRNLADDPAHAADAARLKAALDQWFHRYADPAVDGAREGVTGWGQRGWAGVRSDGRPTYGLPPDGRPWPIGAPFPRLETRL